MDYPTLLLLLTFLMSCIWIFISFPGNQSPKPPKLPPGPPPYPVIGNILELGQKPHHALTNLSKIYGPLMSLKLGNMTSIVISSPDMAKEALHKNDLVFSGRTIPHAVQALDHHIFSVGFIPASSVQWKALRKACATNIFSSHQLNSTQNLRHRKLQDLIEYVDECCSNGEALDIGQAAFTTVLNSMSNTLFSRDVAGFASNSSREFKDLIGGMLEEAGSPNVVDFFPFLCLVDPQGARSRLDGYFRKFFKFIDDIIEERMKFRASKTDSKICSDVLDSLLGLVEEDNSQLGRFEVLHLLADLFAAGVDTTSSTVEWAMAELLSNPEKLAKTRKELQKFIGKDMELKESHISKLPFLRAVVKETLRLHPPAPLLLPRKAQDDAQICGFAVPKNAQLLVNAWAIGRDTSIWCNPNFFEPERFLESNIEFKGCDFELIPFGAGRRICPGLPLAYRAVHLMLASLIHNYDWKLADGLQPNEIDMEEKFGLTLKKVHPLKAIPIKAYGACNHQLQY